MLGAGAVVLAAIGLAGTGAATASTAAPPPSPWLQTGYNAALSDANLTESTLATRNVGTLRSERSISATRSTQCFPGEVYLQAPVFSESRVYSVQSDRLTANNISTGATLWSTPLGPRTRYSYTVVSHGLVIIASAKCTAGANYISAYHSDTGQLAWSRRTVDGGAASLSASGAYLLAQSGVGGDSAGAPYYGSTAVYSVQTGALAWKLGGAGRPGTDCVPMAAIVYGLTFTYDCSSTTLQARSLATGATVWTRAGDQRVDVGDLDTLAAHHVFVTNNATGRIEDVNPKNGQTRYSLPKGIDVVEAVDSGRVYAASAIGDNIAAYNLADGAPIWTRTISSSYLQASAVEANGVLYTYSGPVLDAASGRLLTTLPVGASLVGDGLVGIQDPNKFDTLLLYGLPGS